MHFRVTGGKLLCKMYNDGGENDDIKSNTAKHN